MYTREGCNFIFLIKKEKSKNLSRYMTMRIFPTKASIDINAFIINELIKQFQKRKYLALNDKKQFYPHQP